MTRLGYTLVTTVLATSFAALFTAITLIAPRPWLVWNASASAPIGLYGVTAICHPAVGDLIALLPPDGLARTMAMRHYLPAGLPLLKHVAALSGTWVCRQGSAVTINGRPAAVALARDSHGRSLPVWRGCQIVAQGDIFLLNAAADSFDGRYFGPISSRGLIGRATPLLTRDAPDRPLRWRGPGIAHTVVQPRQGHLSCG